MLSKVALVGLGLVALVISPYKKNLEGWFQKNEALVVPAVVKGSIYRDTKKLNISPDPAHVDEHFNIPGSVAVLVSGQANIAGSSIGAFLTQVLNNHRVL